MTERRKSKSIGDLWKLNENERKKESGNRVKKKFTGEQVSKENVANNPYIYPYAPLNGQVPYNTNYYPQQPFIHPGGGDPNYTNLRVDGGNFYAQHQPPQTCSIPFNTKSPFLGNQSAYQGWSNGYNNYNYTPNGTLNPTPVTQNYVPQQNGNFPLYQHKYHPQHNFGQYGQFADNMAMAGITNKRPINISSHPTNHLSAGIGAISFGGANFLNESKASTPAGPYYPSYGPPTNQLGHGHNPAQPISQWYGDTYQTGTVMTPNVGNQQYWWNGQNNLPNNGPYHLCQATGNAPTTLDKNLQSQPTYYVPIDNKWPSSQPMTSYVMPTDGVANNILNTSIEESPLIGKHSYASPLSQPQCGQQSFYWNGQSFTPITVDNLDPIITNQQFTSPTAVLPSQTVGQATCCGHSNDTNLNSKVSHVHTPVQMPLYNPNHNENISLINSSVDSTVKMGKMLDTEISLPCGQFKANSHDLENYSSYFKVELTGQKDCAEKKINLALNIYDYVTTQNFNKLLNYFSTGNINITINEALEFYRMAVHWRIDNIIKMFYQAQILFKI